MKLAIAATCLLLGNGSTGEASQLPSSVSNQRILETDHQRSSEQTATKIHNSHTNPLLKRLLRRVQNQKRARRLENQPSISTDISEHDGIKPDLGIIGQINSDLNSMIRHRRTERESIMDQQEIRESTAYDGVSMISNDDPEEYSAMLIDFLKYTCMEQEESATIGCDCGDFDFGIYNGTIQCSSDPYCQSATNYCGEIVEICYGETISFEASNMDSYSYTTCLTYTAPYQQHVCINFAVEGNENDSNSTMINYYDDAYNTVRNSSCSAQFNNMKCNSCSVETYEAGKERCFVIDCSNTGDGTNIIDTCDKGFPTSLRDNVIFDEDCSKCRPCGLGYHIENLDAEGVFPQIGEYQCSGLELAAAMGFLDNALCPSIQEKTAEYCGCTPNFFDPALAQMFASSEPTSNSGSKNYLNSDKDKRTVEFESPIALPGDTMGAANCDVCGSSHSKVANPHALVTLPNGVVTTCAALQSSGQLGLFSSDYCRAQVMPLVFRDCGGCFHDQEMPAPFSSGQILKRNTENGDATAAAEENEENDEENQEEINDQTNDATIKETNDENNDVNVDLNNDENIDENNGDLVWGLSGATARTSNDDEIVSMEKAGHDESPKELNVTSEGMGDEGSSGSNPNEAQSAVESSAFSNKPSTTWIVMTTAWFLGSLLFMFQNKR